MLRLPATDGAWSGAIAVFDHPPDCQPAGQGLPGVRPDLREFARTVRPGGWLLVAFHVDSPEFAAGEVNHLTDWFGQPVELDGYLVHFTWHIVTVMLLAFSVLLMTLAWAGIADLKTLLLRWLAVFWLAATATIFWVARRRVRNLLCPPIPLLFVVIAVMCWAAST